MMRTPRGGRMGIPLCRGMHSVASERDCPECGQVERDLDRNKLLNEHNELLAAGLDERDRPRRRQYTPPPEPPTPRQKEIIVKGGIDVRARRPSTDT